MKKASSRDKSFQNAAQTQESYQNLSKTQAASKSRQKDILNNHNSQAIKGSGNGKKIQSGKTLPSKDIQFQSNNKVGKVDYAPEENMTESRIYQARKGLQLLKKKMAKGLSREKPIGSYHKIEDNGVSLGNQQDSAHQSQNRLRHESQSKIPYSSHQTTNLKNDYDRKSPSIPSQQMKSGSRQMVKKVAGKPENYNPQPKYSRGDTYVNQTEEVAIQPKGDFMALLQAEIRKENQNLNGKSKNQNPGRNLPNDDYGQDDGGELVQCGRGCGRMFNSEAITKHEKICERVFQSKRKAFNSAEFRQPETEGMIPQKQVQTNAKHGRKSTKVIEKPQSSSTVPKWKLQSAQFRAVLKQGKGEEISHEEKKIIEEQDTRVMCNFCGRKFAKETADRHIPFCQTKSKQMPKMNTTMKKKK